MQVGACAEAVGVEFDLRNGEAGGGLDLRNEVDHGAALRLQHRDGLVRSDLSPIQMGEIMLCIVGAAG